MKFKHLCRGNQEFLVMKTNRSHCKLLFERNTITNQWEKPVERRLPETIEKYGHFIYKWNKIYKDSTIEEFYSMKRMIEKYPELMLL